MVDNNTPPNKPHKQTPFTYYHPTSFSTQGYDDDGELSVVVKEQLQDRLLPIANVGRIMKQILPPNAKISKEGKETMQECVSEFISFVTGEASDKCGKEKRKTVNGDDICWALGNLGFDDYAEPLKRYLVKYREAEGERANQNRAAAGEDAGFGRRTSDGETPVTFSFDLMEKGRN
ncbi:hypothetical protein ACS0TY_007776 [Phlomoides rotata]